MSTSDFASLSSEEKQAAERAQDEHREKVHCARLDLDSAIVTFNALRAESGLAPVTLMVPEEAM